MLRQVLKPVVQTTRTVVRSYHPPAYYKPPHMNELPIPAGSFKEAYAKTNARNNMQLILGIGVLAATIAFAAATDAIHLNWTMPKPPK